jgi:L-seryl-tRNA(Ser) seleniumtransferase
LQSSIVNRQSSIINATGVIIHTNLGRATLSVAAQEAMLAAARDYTPLEFDMHTGERGRRGEAVEKLLCDLTGAEAAVVVNNCAAATVLMLAATSAGKGVVVSRGQLVEIGGGFRVPEIMAQSGAKLIEVGTTNRTKPADYKRAIEPHPEVIGALLRVHSSNFKMIGFTEEVGVDELVGIAQQFPIPVLDDLGSGALIDTSQFGLSREPMPQDSVKAGASIVAFSGDKLLGGPQAGIMVGQREWIEKCRRHPLARAFRADKFTLAALGATLMHYARGEAQRDVPVIRMMAMRKDEIAQRAEKVILALGVWFLAHQLRAELIDGESTVGGGSLPGETLPTTLIALSSDGETRSIASLQTQLRAAGVIARIKDDRVLLDLRTVLDDPLLVARLTQT